MEILSQIITYLSKEAHLAQVVNAIVIPLIGISASFLRHRHKVMDRELQEIKERELSVKRSTLRSEYLSVFNSDVLTIDEKYRICCSIYADYKKYNGNHYIDELHTHITEMYTEKEVQDVSKNQLESTDEE